MSAFLAFFSSPLGRQLIRAVLAMAGGWLSGHGYPEVGVAIAGGAAALIPSVKTVDSVNAPSITSASPKP